MSRNVLCSLWERKLRISGVAAVNCARAITAGPGACARGYHVDYRSYVEYECEKAKSDELAIVVLYNSTHVDRNRCPDCIKWSGKHAAMQYCKNGKYYWGYQAIKEALS